MPYTYETDCISIHLLESGQLTAYLDAADPIERRWVESNHFSAEAGTMLRIADVNGQLVKVLVGYDKAAPLAALHVPAQRLPAANYRLELPADDTLQERLLLMGWGFSSYCFDRYKSRANETPLLYLPEHQRAGVEAQLAASNLVRDLINTPATDLGPAELSAVAAQIAQRFDAQFTHIDGQQLIDEYPAIYAVGMGSDKPPALIHFTWGDPGHPVLCLVGKGVTFDTGGLNIKSGSRMMRMKKDMGGSAHILGLAQLIMEAALPVRLQVFIPTVENMISGRSYRPGDVIHTRRGLTVEITNTDAEGRLILADALTRAGEEKPDLMIDFATLTGAARIALGPDISPFFTNSSELAAELMRQGEEHADPLWQLPIVAEYQRYLDSNIADMMNCSPGSFAGAINAAVFLQHFVEADIPWLHFDVYGWNDNSRPARPAGGEAQGMRATFEFLKQRYT